MHFSLNFRASESDRLLIAVLVSLVLHALFLFFVRLAPPSRNPPTKAIPLNVILEKRAAEVSKPTGIPQASLDSKGEARIGVQETNAFPQKKLTAATNAQVEQSGTEIPKGFVGKKILTINKPAKTTMVESEPDLLVTKSTPPETPEIEEKPIAPTPSVENPVATPAPPIEKLVSPEPVPGEKQEKIVIAEPSQEKLAAEKSGSSAREPEPVKIEEPKPEKVEEPRPAKVAEPEPVKIEETKPVMAEVTKPGKIEESVPAKAEEPKPAMAGAVVANIQPPDDGKPDVSHAKTTGHAAPSLAALSIATVRNFNFSGKEHKPMQFGERRKSVGLKEQDFRYAVYVEEVCLKLQRIGAFNYPAAAARNNQSGTLSVKISLRPDGSLEDFSIVRPSMYEALNAGAEKIVRMSAPFSPLPDNIKKDTDILSITINWTFSNSMQSLD